MTAPHDQSCSAGLTAAQCARQHVAASLTKGSSKDYICPLHDDHHASLSVNPGSKGQRMVWNCKAHCDPSDLREWFLASGVDESCLGRYGAPKRDIAPGMPAGQYRADPGVLASAKRWAAVQKLPITFPGQLYFMCVQAIAEGDGDLPGDPERLLPFGWDDFVGLGVRTGLNRRYVYQLYRKWVALHP